MRNSSLKISILRTTVKIKLQQYIFHLELLIFTERIKKKFKSGLL